MDVTPAQNPRRVRGNTAPIQHWLTGIRERPLIHRAIVVAPESLAAVRDLGGWIFDITAAGWQVAVVTPDLDHQNSLRILGVSALDLKQALSKGIRTLEPDHLAVATELYNREEKLRDTVVRSLRQTDSVTTLWGSDLPSELNGMATVRPHRPSSAALAFKTAAIHAAGYPDEISTTTETMWSPHKRALQTVPGRTHG
ncbi:hypothetical protein [Nocardia aurea]|uniref:hypothetical protein n=1 Tax=Nocardia aurea TaxID=2144174 RepID=UPI00339F5785